MAWLHASWGLPTANKLWTNTTVWIRGHSNSVMRCEHYSCTRTTLDESVLAPVWVGKSLLCSSLFVSDFNLDRFFFHSPSPTSFLQGYTYTWMGDVCTQRQIVVFSVAPISLVCFHPWNSATDSCCASTSSCSLASSVAPIHLLPVLHRFPSSPSGGVK